MRNQKIKEVSARVVLTPMPDDGVDQFTFMKRSEELSANKVEALIQFSDSVDPKDLFGCLNKLLGVFLNDNPSQITTEEAMALEHTYNYILNTWKSETDSFEMMHPTFLAG